MSIEKRKQFIINVLYLGIWIGIVFVLLKYGMPALTPFVIAWVISLLVKRPIEFVMKKLNISRRLAAIPVVLVFFGTVGVLVTLVGLKVIAEIVSVVGIVPNMYMDHVSPLVNTILESVEESVISRDPTLVTAVEEVLSQLVKAVGDILSGLSVKVMSVVASFTSSLPGLFINLVLTIISTFFITMDYDKFTKFFYDQLTGKKKETFLEIKEYVVGTLFVCIRSYALIMSITFVELSIGLSILRIENAVMIAALISIFDILPVLGTGGIMIPWVVIALIQRNYALSIGLLVVYIVVTVIRNIIEPKIVGKQIGLHPILTLSSMFLGVQLFGVVGLFGFPIGLSLIRNLNEKGVIQWFRMDSQK